jgi:hypothetical protein
VSGALDALAARLRAQGGLLAAATQDAPPGARADLGRAAAGPRTGAEGDDYALLVEAIHEGYLAHYGEGRVLRSPEPDLELLAGDHLYALGLERLAELGDLESVAVLAGVIARCAQAHAEDRPQDADAAWREGAARVAGSGTGPNG